MAQIVDSLVFLPAPRFGEVRDDVLCTLSGEVVGVQRGNRLVLTFHPELSEDSRYHRMLLEACADRIAFT